MTTSDTHATPIALRAAEPGDVEAIASVWYAGWREAHIGQVHRGAGVAAALLAHGETVISATSPRAFLAVVAGNARARRFYERQGWHDVGPFDYLAWTSDGARVPVPSHRYEKELRPAS